MWMCRATTTKKKLKRDNFQAYQLHSMCVSTRAHAFVIYFSHFFPLFVGLFFLLFVARAATTVFVVVVVVSSCWRCRCRCHLHVFLWVFWQISPHIHRFNYIKSTIVEFISTLSHCHMTFNAHSLCVFIITGILFWFFSSFISFCFLSSIVCSLTQTIRCILRQRPKIKKKKPKRKIL